MLDFTAVVVVVESVCVCFNSYYRSLYLFPHSLNCFYVSKNKKEAKA